jgi:catalase-peroxidase
MGADEEPGRRAAVEAEGRRRRHRARRARPEQAHQPMMLTTDLALKVDPAYRKISERFHKNPESSTPPSRRPGTSSRTATWAARALLGPRCRSAALAGPGAGRRSSAGRRAGRRALKSKVLASGLSDLAARVDRVGFGVLLPRLRHARWRQRRARAPRAAEGLGVNEPAELAKASRRSKIVRKDLERTRRRRQEDLARRPDRARGLRRRRRSGKRAGHDVDACRSRPAAPTRRRR